MDERTVGLVVGIAGSVVGVAVGFFEAYCGIRNSRGPAEHAFAVRASILVGLAVTTLLAGLLLVPQPWNGLLWVPYGPALWWGIRWGKKGQARAHARDLAAREATGDLP